MPGDLGGLTLTRRRLQVRGGARADRARSRSTPRATPNAVFVFQAGSTLITASASRVNLINGAQPCNVFWQVGSSATLGTTSVFAGNILALTSISMNNGVTLHGRALARNGAVTLINDTITAAHCAGELDVSRALPADAGIGANQGVQPNEAVEEALVDGRRRPDALHLDALHVDALHLDALTWTSSTWTRSTWTAGETGAAAPWARSTWTCADCAIGGPRGTRPADLEQLALSRSLVEPSANGEPRPHATGKRSRSSVGPQGRCNAEMGIRAACGRLTSIEPVWGLSAVIAAIAATLYFVSVRHYGPVHGPEIAWWVLAAAGARHRALARSSSSSAAARTRSR